jgi:ATP adenylyltransferase
VGPISIVPPSNSTRWPLELTDTEAAELDRLYGDRDGFLLAVRHRWMTALTAKLDQAAHADISPQQVRSELAERNPGLRALLDTGLSSSVRVRALRHGEQQVLDLYTGPAIVRRTA